MLVTIHIVNLGTIDLRGRHTATPAHGGHDIEVGYWKANFWQPSAFPLHHVTRSRDGLCKSASRDCWEVGEKDNIYTLILFCRMSVGIGVVSSCLALVRLGR